MRYILMYFGSVAQSLSSGVSPVAIGHPNQRAPLRRPVKTTRILIAVEGPGTDCFRSQLRRLGFGQPHQARPRHGCAKIPCGSQAGPSKPELSTLVATGTSYFGPTRKVLLPNGPDKMFLIARWSLTCYNLKHIGG